MSCPVKDDGTSSICMNPDDILAQLSGAEADNIQTGKDLILNQLEGLEADIDAKIKVAQQILDNIRLVSTKISGNTDIITLVDKINTPKDNLALSDAKILEYLSKTTKLEPYKSALQMFKAGNRTGAIKSVRSGWKFLADRN